MDADALQSLPTPDRRGLALAILVATVLLAGCGFLADDGPALPDGETAAEQYEDLDVYRATFVTEFTVGNETNRTEGEVVARPGTGQFYQEIYNSSLRENTLVVSNGTVTWRYNETKNEATRLSIDGRSQFDYQRNQIRRLINRAQSDDNSGGARLPIAPILPTTQTSGDGQTLSAGPVTVEYEGIETAAGRDAHVISMNATESAFEQTMYLDTEWFLQLRAESEMMIDGRRMETVYQLEDVEFNPDVGSEQFIFEPPDDATIVDGTGDTADRTVYETRTDLVADVEIAVPEPTLPQGFELQRAEHTIGLGFESVSLQYTSDVAIIGVTKQNMTIDQTEDDAETVEVGNRTGTYDRFGPQAVVSWDCAGNSYTVSGDSTRENLLSVAESIECE